MNAVGRLPAMSAVGVYDDEVAPGMDVQPLPFQYFHCHVRVAPAGLQAPGSTVIGVPTAATPVPVVHGWPGCIDFPATGSAMSCLSFGCAALGFHAVAPARSGEPPRQREE